MTIENCELSRFRFSQKALVLVCLAVPLTALALGIQDVLVLAGQRVIERVINYNFGLLFLAVAMWVAAFLFELFMLGYDRSSLKRLLAFEKNERLDVICFFVYNFLTTGVIIAVFTAGLSFMLRVAIEVHLGFQILPLCGSVTLATVAAVLSTDFMAYWKHRLSHRLDFWWQAHKYHHSAINLNLITNNRRHPLDHGIGYIAFAIPTALLGVPEELILPIVLVRAFIVRIRHSELDLDYGLLRYVLVSPNFHRCHHLRDVELSSFNYGYLFSFWDLIHGTWHPPIRPGAELVYGTEEFDARQHGFLAGWIVCLVDVLKSLGALLPVPARLGFGRTEAAGNAEP